MAKVSILVTRLLRGPLVLGTIFAPTYDGFSFSCDCFVDRCRVLLLQFFLYHVQGGAAVYQFIDNQLIVNRHNMTNLL